MAILVVAILLQRSKPQEKTKEGFIAALIEQDWKVSMGIGVTVGVVAVLLIGFIVYYFTQPKKYNVANMPVGRRWAVPYNME